MGSKGSQTSQTNQSQTYAPAGAGYIQNALNTAQNAAQLPFNIPQAPVAGFSQDQQNAFNTVNNAQGMAQPYINQAAQDFSAQGAQNFLNPYASNVMAQMQNLYGQQQSQNTANLTQSAGGVGADRIAVGQGNLANQQDLAAGQTMSGLYSNAVQQAQSAGYGTAALGSQAQNAALSGAQAQLGTGGLQQQLSQAQLNSPYQQQLAQAAFPYQQSQFLSGAVGSLAPGLGGTTTGQGNTTSQYNPSIWGQIGGGIQALGGIGGYLGGSGSGKGGTPGTSIGGSYGPTSYGGSAGPTPLVARGGAIPGYDTGGATSPYGLPSGFNDNPINVGQEQLIPQGNIPAIHAQQPQLNLNPPQQSQQQGSGGSNSGAGIGTAVKLASMFMARGGAANPYFSDGGAFHPYFDGGGTVDDATRKQGIDLLRGAMNDPFASAGQAAPYRTDPAADQNWRDATPLPDGSGSSVPMPQARPAAADEADVPDQAAATSGALPAAAPPQGAADSGPSLGGFLSSPWAAVTAGGLDAMRTGSLASGFGTTMKLAGEQREAGQKDTTIKQAADRLKQEAKFHEDQFSRMTPYQKGELGNKEAELEYKKQLLGSAMMSDSAIDLTVDRIHAGDPRALQNLGRGATSGPNLTRIQNRLAERAAAEGWTGADLAAATANFTSQAAAARTAAVRSANVESSVEEAQRTFPLVREASVNLPRGTVVPWNQLVQMAQKGTSDPRLATLVTAIQGARTAYSQAMSRTGVNSVHAMQAADQLLSQATSQEALFATLTQMEKEMQAAQAAPDEVRKKILARISGRTGAPPAAAGAATAAAPPAAAAPTAAPAAGAKPDPATRYGQLRASGLSEQEIYKKLHDEGY